MGSPEGELSAFLQQFVLVPVLHPQSFSGPVWVTSFGPEAATLCSRCAGPQASRCCLCVSLPGCLALQGRPMARVPLGMGLLQVCKMPAAV